MQKTYILSKREVEEINKLYNTNLYSIMIQQIGNKYYAIIDCDLKIKVFRKEVEKYFN
ncbi:unknown [Mycoplasma sp. CAG:877]|nr:unknown [Mycoplasma sp. CAG:877]